MEFCTRTVSTSVIETPAKVVVAEAIDAMNVSSPAAPLMVSPALREVKVAVADMVPVMVSAPVPPSILSIPLVSVQI